MTGGAAVQRLRQNREPDRDTPDVETLRCLLDEQLVAPRLRRRLKDPIRIIGQPFIRPEQPDVAIDAVVVGLEIVVGDRPVVAEAVKTLAAEIIGTEPQRDTSPMIRPAAEHSRAKPVKAFPRRRRIRLAFQRPAAPAGVELAELTLGNR